MRSVFWLLAAVAIAEPASAADAPTIGPPAAWVKPADLVKPLAIAASDTAPVKVLLRDSQTAFEAAGDSIYFESVVQARTDQGLAELGTLSLPWKPGTSTLTVHKVHILRGTQVIDALAGHEFTVLRRETNLESATLDGVLTATLQVEGLEVGDALDVAATITRNDPVMGGQSEAVLDAGSAIAVEHLRMRALWPKAKAIRWRVGSAVAKPTFSQTGDLSELVIEARDVEPYRAPKGAPARYARGRELEFTQFASWGDISRLFAPLYAKAAILAPGSPVKAEAARIAAASSDPAQRAAAALALVQEKVRYVFLGINDGALTPAVPDVTWARRFGDCKAKTTLLLALLNELGVTAQPALVSTTRGDGLDQRLPTVEVFDHILVRAVIAGKVYWLDGTRPSDRSLAILRVPPFHWALPLQMSGGSLTALTQSPLTTPDSEVVLRLDASAGLDVPAPAHAEMIFRGDTAIALNLQMANVPPTDMDRGLRQMWRKMFESIEVKSSRAGFDKATGTERLVMEGTAKMAWPSAAPTLPRRFEVDGSVLGGKADFKRDPGPGVDAPYFVPFPAFDHHLVSIVLPLGGAGFSFTGENIDRTVAAMALHRASSIKSGVFTMDASQRTLAAEFPAKDAVLVETALAGLSKNVVHIVVPQCYAGTPQEYAQIVAQTPTTAEGYVQRGSLYDSRSDHRKALADFTKALEMTPGDAQALERRAAAEWSLDDADAALADLDALIKQHQDEGHMRMFRAEILRDLGRDEAAKAEFDAAVATAPGDPELLLQRAWAWSRMGRRAEAIAVANKLVAEKPAVALYVARADLRDHADVAGRLADYVEVLKLDPKSVYAIDRRADLRVQSAEYTLGLSELDAAIHAQPTVPHFLRLRGNLHAKAGQLDLAEADFVSFRNQVSALAIDNNDLCWTEAAFPPLLTTALKDCEAALKLDATLGGIHDSHALVLMRLGRLDEALAEFDLALQMSAHYPGSLYARGLTRLKRGQTQAGQTDIALARRIDPQISWEYDQMGLKP